MPCSVGAHIAIDLTNEKGGVLGKYKVEAISADGQSKVDVAINETERLIHQENCDIILGVYSSATAVSNYSVVFTGETLPDGTEDLLNYVELRSLDYDHLKQLAPRGAAFL